MGRGTLNKIAGGELDTVKEIIKQYKLQVLNKTYLDADDTDFFKAIGKCIAYKSCLEMIVKDHLPANRNFEDYDFDEFVKFVEKRIEGYNYVTWCPVWNPELLKNGHSYLRHDNELIQEYLDKGGIMN